MNFREHVWLARKNYRTTLGGLGVIAAALSDIFLQISNKDFDGSRLGADITGLITGYTLLFARDSAVSEEAHRVDRVSIAENTAAREALR